MAARKKARKAAKPAKKAVKGVKARKVTKKAVKRSVAKKTTAKKSVGGPISVGRKPFSKSQLVTTIAERTDVARKDVSAVLESVSAIVGAHLQKSGPEVFNWPGLFKILVVKKPATKSRQGINPFTGEMMTFKAKPASRRVKIRPLKQLKEMAS